MSIWQKEISGAINNFVDAESFFETPFPKTPYPIFIPRPFAQKIKNQGPNSPLWKQFLPLEDENNPKGAYDPIGDLNHFVTNQLIHRYSNRALFLPLKICPINCRYCFRKNEIFNTDPVFKSDFQKTWDYLNQHTEINEIIFSGGDPLLLSDQKILHYLIEFKKIKHIKYIRFHTRTPIILPSRINSSFLAVLKEARNWFKQINIVIHTNHAEEIDYEVEEVLKNLFFHHPFLLSQSVLLKGVNNSVSDLKNLFEKLIDNHVKPYYLHHPDQVKGGMHFYLSLEEGRKVYSGLRKVLSGWAIPEYIIDIPTGEGKIQAFNPESIEFKGSLLNKEGRLVNINSEDNLH